MNNKLPPLWLVVGLMMFPQIVETIYSPVLTHIATEFRVSEGQASQTLSVYFLAFAAGVVCWGRLCDLVGRRPAMLAGLMIVRRIGEYAFVRPGREMLFAPLDAESKYKAKNFIDTVVYRGGDALSGWAKAGLDLLGHGAWLVAMVGALCAALWGVLGWYLGGQADQRSVEQQLATTR